MASFTTMRSLHSSALALALLVASLAGIHCQAQTQAGPAETSAKKPLEPLDVTPKPVDVEPQSSASEENSARALPFEDVLTALTGGSDSFVEATASMLGEKGSEGLTSLVSTEGENPFDKKLPKKPLSNGGLGLSAIQKQVSEYRTSTTSGPKQTTKSSHMVHMSSSSSDGQHEEQTFVSHDGGEPELVEHSSDEGGTPAVSAIANAVASGSIPPKEEKQHVQPTWHHVPEGELEDEEEEFNQEEAAHEPEFQPRKPEKISNDEQPIERVDETYVDESDPSDPKLVHINKEVKAHVGPNSESYSQKESKVANSIGANPNSYSHHYSSSSSSYSKSQSGTGGGNYAHYRPPQASAGARPPYNNEIPRPLPPLPVKPNTVGPYQFPPFPQMPHAPAMPEAWLNVAQRNPSFGHPPPPPPPPLPKNLIPGVQKGYGPERPHHMRTKRNGKNKRHLSARLGKRLERFERRYHRDSLGEFI